MKTLIALTLLALPVVTVAHEPIRGVSIPTYEDLYMEESASGESLDDFAMRIASKVKNVTSDIGYETCGSFQKNGDRYRIQFSTSYSRFACSIDVSSAGPWMTTGKTMHSHTKGGGHYFSKNDLAVRLEGYVVSTHYLIKREGNKESSKRLP